MYKTPAWFTGIDQVSNEDANDILVTAIEGGINYWAMVDQYAPGSVFSTAYVIDSESNRVFYVQSDLDGWKNAIVKAAREFDQTIADFIEDHDAGSADVAMQIYCFGKVIYG